MTNQGTLPLPAAPGKTTTIGIRTKETGTEVETKTSTEAIEIGKPTGRTEIEGAIEMIGREETREKIGIDTRIETTIDLGTVTGAIETKTSREIREMTEGRSRKKGIYPDTKFPLR